MKLYMPGEKGKAICEEGGRVGRRLLDELRDQPRPSPGVATPEALPSGRVRSWVGELSQPDAE